MSIFPKIKNIFSPADYFWLVDVCIKSHEFLKTIFTYKFNENTLNGH